MVNLHKYYYLIFAGSLIVYSWYLIIYILVFNCILDAEPSKSLNCQKKKKKEILFIALESRYYKYKLCHILLLFCIIDSSNA